MFIFDNLKNLYNIYIYLYIFEIKNLNSIDLRGASVK